MIERTQLSYRDYLIWQLSKTARSLSAAVEDAMTMETNTDNEQYAIENMEGARTIAIALLKGAPDPISVEPRPEFKEEEDEDDVA